jgi:hypothetical protein
MERRMVRAPMSLLYGSSARCVVNLPGGSISGHNHESSK